MASSTNYPGHGPGARSLQWNAIRRVTDQSSVYRVLFILQISLPTSSLTDSYAVRGGVAMRKSVKQSFFVNNFQTVGVVEVLS